MNNQSVTVVNWLTEQFVTLHVLARTSEQQKKRERESKVVQCQAAADKQNGASLIRTDSRAPRLTARSPNSSPYVKFAYVIRKLHCVALTEQTEISILVASQKWESSRKTAQVHCANILVH
jgi:hypothetical protein